MAPFDTPYATFHWSAIVNIALSCTIFKFFDVEQYHNLEIRDRGHSRSLKLVPHKSLGAVSYSPSIVTVAVSVPICEMIFSVKALENQVRGHSRSFKMAPFDKPYATFYCSAIVNIALCCTIFELFDVE